MFHIDKLLNQGFIFLQQGKLLEAKNNFEQVLKISPNHFDALQLLGLLFGKNKQYSLAVEFLTRALNINPNHTASLNNLGNALKELRFFKDAIINYEKAIKLQPDYQDAYNNLALALKEINLFEEAINNYKIVINLNPVNVEAYNNLGVLFMELLYLEEAGVMLKKAIFINSNYSNAHWNLSFCYLLAGNLKDGFREYEWRWESKSLQGSKRHYQIPLWLGEESLVDKTILIYGEQGLGDMIQFSRYIEMVASLGASVILEVPNSLHQLMTSLKGMSKLIAPEEDLPHVDYQCPMMSLPLAFKTELTTIPASIPYLSTSEEKKWHWQRRLGPHSRPRVGLIWSGGFRPDQPELWSVNNRRNIALEKLRILKNIDVQFFSLQKGAPAESELSELRERGWDGPDILDLSSELIDLTDTAALIENLDLIISVDTSIAHLAGALGKTVWLLNRYDTCWRWLVNRKDSPWYPSLKIYRQESYANWDDVLELVQDDLTYWSKNFISK